MESEELKHSSEKAAQEDDLNIIKSFGKMIALAVGIFGGKYFYNHYGLETTIMAGALLFLLGHLFDSSKK